MLKDLFDKHDGEFLEFARIPDYARLHPRPDLCGLLYLHQRLGGTGDAVAAAEHDQVWLCWDEKDLAALTEEDVIYLRRCGIWYDEDTESLSMFV